jgi:hypothetical protein
MVSTDFSIDLVMLAIFGVVGETDEVITVVNKCFIVAGDRMIVEDIIEEA